MDVMDLLNSNYIGVEEPMKALTSVDGGMQNRNRDDASNQSKDTAGPRDPGIELSADDSNHIVTKQALACPYKRKDSEYTPKPGPIAAGWATREGWARHRSYLTKLYMEENLPLDHVRRLMEIQHGFLATKKMYQHRFRQWSLLKNIKRVDMEAILRVMKHRDKLGKDTEVLVSGRVLSAEKLKRFTRQYPDIARRELEAVPDFLLRRNIVVRTPSPEPLSIASWKYLDYPGDQLSLVLLSARNYIRSIVEDGWCSRPYDKLASIGQVTMLQSWYEEMETAIALLRSKKTLAAFSKLQLASGQISEVLRAENSHPYVILATIPAISKLPMNELHEMLGGFIAEMSTLLLGARHPIAVAWQAFKTCPSCDRLNACRVVIECSTRLLEDIFQNEPKATLPRIWIDIGTKFLSSNTEDNSADGLGTVGSTQSSAAHQNLPTLKDIVNESPVTANSRNIGSIVNVEDDPGDLGDNGMTDKSQISLLGESLSAFRRSVSTCPTTIFSSVTAGESTCSSRSSLEPLELDQNEEEVDASSLAKLPGPSNSSSSTDSNSDLDGPPSPWHQSYPSVLPDLGSASLTESRPMSDKTGGTTSPSSHAVDEMNGPDSGSADTSEQTKNTSPGSGGGEGTAYSEKVTQSSTQFTRPGIPLRCDRVRDKRENDEDGEFPDPKRPRLSPMAVQQSRSRSFAFACPYQKFDPVGSPFCCSPSNKNMTGGCISIPRVKEHIFRNHSISLRCNRCWLKFDTEQALQLHAGSQTCPLLPCHVKYAMTAEQELKLKPKLRGTDEEKWYFLFRICLPDIRDEDMRRYTPYYHNPGTRSLRPEYRDPTPPTSFSGSQSDVPHANVKYSRHPLNSIQSTTESDSPICPCFPDSSLSSISTDTHLTFIRPTDKPRDISNVLAKSGQGAKAVLDNDATPLFSEHEEDWTNFLNCNFEPPGIPITTEAVLPESIPITTHTAGGSASRVTEQQLTQSAPSGQPIEREESFPLQTTTLTSRNVERLTREIGQFRKQSTSLCAENLALRHRISSISCDVDTLHDVLNSILSGSVPDHLVEQLFQMSDVLSNLRSKVTNDPRARDGRDS